MAILAGEAHPATEAVVLNAGAALAIATDGDLRGSAVRARQAIADGSATRKLDAWKAVAVRMRSPS
jgi:anthranilate phosphoribosyltransferase